MQTQFIIPVIQFPLVQPGVLVDEHPLGESVQVVLAPIVAAQPGAGRRHSPGSGVVFDGERHG